MTAQQKHINISCTLKTRRGRERDTVNISELSVKSNTGAGVSIVVGCPGW